ncbi:DUF4383 domain-containing protein [Lysobacter sp. GX 14042]|uniref:DUF4383 domain-containing protein n=1 Tax=Lysobacter sp. GX 14042 TaxID=2907155 RepID=UPI001F477D7A|nr:DUF4383 domain-containing protein [Lysobacter sp. GX 14042]MCE7033412.1 DUF4383 domain-containing protein [Lysobacter sp. GX 14042]
MNGSIGLCRAFAAVIGAFLLVEGFLGLSSPVVFGVLSTNMLHAVIHIALGAAGIWTGLRSGARQFCLFLGILLLTVGALWFVPGIREIIILLLNVNAAVAYLNLGVGAVALLLALAARGAGVRARV